MQYIVQVKDLDGKTTYYCAKNKYEAQLYRDSTPKYVHIFSSQEFLNSLPKLPINWKDFDGKLDDYLL
jgi:hypothetical protein